MSKKKTAKTAKSSVPKINKREFVTRLLKADANPNWPREMKVVNRLFEQVPDPVFWNSIELKFKLNSLCWLQSDKGRAFLNDEYRKFKLVLNKKKEYEIGENDVEFEVKSRYNKKALNLRDFLKLWQKKSK